MAYVTSEKQAPSPIQMAAEIAEAIKAEKLAGRCGARSPLKDNLNKVIAEYNKLTTVKRHRIRKLTEGADLQHVSCLYLSTVLSSILSFAIPS